MLSKILETIRSVGDGVPEADTTPAGLTGISGRKTVGLLRSLARLFADDSSACYLEIGVFQGMTLISTALAAPHMPCLGVDNFRILDPKGRNLELVRKRISQYRATNARLINMDFEDALRRLPELLSGRRVALYYIDGPHDYRSQLLCLLWARRFIHESGVIIIDDANYSDVRYATRDFLIASPKYRLAFDAYSPSHPANMNPTVRSRWEEGWLNGVHVIVHDYEGRMPEMLPPVDDDRTLFFNEWLVHRTRMAELAPEALILADAVCRGDAADEDSAREALRRRYDTIGNSFNKRFSDRNTYSSGLPAQRLNRLIERSKPVPTGEREHLPGDETGPAR